MWVVCRFAKEEKRRTRKFLEVLQRENVSFLGFASNLFWEVLRDILGWVVLLSCGCMPAIIHWGFKLGCDLENLCEGLCQIGLVAEIWQPANSRVQVVCRLSWQ